MIIDVQILQQSDNVLLDFSCVSLYCVPESEFFMDALVLFFPLSSLRLSACPHDLFISDCRILSLSAVSTSLLQSLFRSYLQLFDCCICYFISSIILRVFLRSYGTNIQQQVQYVQQCSSLPNPQHQSQFISGKA